MARERTVSDVCEVLALAGHFGASYKALFMHLT